MIENADHSTGFIVVVCLILLGFALHIMAGRFERIEHRLTLLEQKK